MKQLLIFALIATKAVSSYGYCTLNLSTGDITDNRFTTDYPTRNINYLDDGIVVTYNFSSANLRNDEIYPESIVWDIPGAKMSETLGKPLLPHIFDTLILPPGSNPTISLLSSEYKCYNYQLAPARIPLLQNDTMQHTTETVPPITPYSGISPTSACPVLYTSIYRSQIIARICITPISYDYNAKMVYAYTEIKYKIKYNNNKNKSQNQQKIFYEAESLLNPNIDLSLDGTKLFSIDTPEPPNINVNVGYLIISVPEFENSLKPFILWKKQLGYKVTTLYNSNWTTGTIKSAIKELYDNDPSLMYLLIVGDHTKVPAEKKDCDSTPPFYLTDFNYGCMDGADDTEPDIYRGRWPIRTTEQLDNLVEKSIWYERSPIVNPYFYKSATHIGFFEDKHFVAQCPSGIWGYEATGEESQRCVESCEAVRDYLTNNYGYFIDRLYTYDRTFPFCGQALNSPSPNKWNDPNHNGRYIPDDLKEENGFTWEVSNDDIINSFNEGRSYILFNGHGYHNYWSLSLNGSKKFDTTDIAKLDNQNLYPVIFSFTCLTGRHDVGLCFTQGLLEKARSGAVGVFAHTHNSYSDINDGLNSLVFNAIWPKPGFEFMDVDFNYSNITQQVKSQSPILNLGQILDFCLMNFAAIDTASTNRITYSKEIFHCFADPSMPFNRDLPRWPGTVNVIRNENTNSVTVNLEDGPAYISFYDPVSDRSERFYGKSAIYAPTSNLHLKYVSVMVTNPNMIPYADTGEEFNGTISAVSNSHISGWQSIGGSHILISYEISREDLNKNLSMVIVDAKTGAFVSQQTIENNIANEKQRISMLTNRGVMIASLLVNGYPVSNVRMFVSE